ncbi:glycosyltransferase family 4 protein [Cellvibrio sp. NN19]|uniref:glycosyltransferase family 4 protein n=1 Tax=Cellvibrio chitinivorans TaxID=3102792 RepID=UPI002B417935|nr:glycosyltransferase family 4 protein [Cellvibrio sp. NN19]
MPSIKIVLNEMEEIDMRLKYKKICLITIQYPPSWGGVARSSERLVKYLRSEGADVDVVIPMNIDKKMLQAESRQIHLTEISESWSVDKYGARIFTVPIYPNEQQMSKLIELMQLMDYRNHYDLYHGFWLPFAYPALIVSSRLNAPVIASIRGNDAVEWIGLPTYLPFIQAVLYKADWVTSVCSNLLSNVASIEKIDDRSSVILNGIDKTGFPQWSYNNCSVGSVGYVGELRYKKGISFLINAFSRITFNNRQLRLTGSYKSEAEKNHTFDLIERLGIGTECLHLGTLERKELLEEISTLNVFVICSLHDGLPNGLLEAAACGVPIVATRVAGMADVLSHEVNCLLVEPGNSLELAAAISRLLQNKELCNKLSAGALLLAESLNEEQEKRSWLNLYLKLIEKRESSAIDSPFVKGEKILDASEVCI